MTKRSCCNFDDTHRIGETLLQFDEVNGSAAATRNQGVNFFRNIHRGITLPRYYNPIAFAPTFSTYYYYYYSTRSFKHQPGQPPSAYGASLRPLSVRSTPGTRDSVSSSNKSTGQINWHTSSSETEETPPTDPLAPIARNIIIQSNSPSLPSTETDFQKLNLCPHFWRPLKITTR